jgi:hypothetical protein
MNSGNNSPKVPSPTTVAAAQTGSNQSTALYEQLLNMQDQRTPTGSLTWQNAGTNTYTDPTTGKQVSVPKFIASQVLSPTQQGLLDQEEQFDARYNQMAIDQAGQIKNTLSQPFSYSTGEHEAWAGGLYDQLNSESISRGRDEMEQNLANRGLNIGTKAYDTAQQSFTKGNQDARNEFMLDAYGTGLNSALTIRNQPLKEGIALMGGGQMTEPTWVQGAQSGVNGTDVAGIYAANTAAKQQQASQQQGVWGALGQLGGAALGGWMASDERTKTNIKPKGKKGLSRLAEKEWSYKGSSQRHTTPMAQDVEKKYPDAVAEVGGVKYVNWPKVPGGGKYEKDIANERTIDPRLYGQPGWSMNAVPDGEMLRGQRMRNPAGDESWDIKKALPAPREQDARLKGGLSRLGARSVA